MECQYSGCTNVGIHSCESCGKLVCGKHMSWQPSNMGRIPYCTTCAQRSDEQYSKSSGGCGLMFLALPLAFFGVSLLAVHAAVIGILLLVGAVFCLLIGFVRWVSHL